MLQVQPAREGQLDHDKDNPTASKVAEPNNLVSLHFRNEAAPECGPQDHITDPVTPVSGGKSL
jgi:hypothetical protein